MVLPPIAEQQKIAQILDIVDESIRLTLSVIPKLNQIKHGLQEDLLAPKAQDASVATLESLCNLVVDCPHSTPTFTTDGVMVVRTSNVRAGKFIRAGASRVSQREYYERTSRAVPAEGDVIFTREAPVGEAFIVPADLKLCLGQRLMLLRPDPSVLLPEYLLAHIYGGAIRSRLSLVTAGTTNPHINVAEVRNMVVPVPALAEQRKVARILADVDQEIDSAFARARVFSALRRGLMDDLLTGRVRVKVAAGG